MWGIFQVFADTVVICSITALVLLCVSVKTVPIGTALQRNESIQYVSLIDNGEEATALCDWVERPLFNITPDGRITESEEKTYINVMALKKTENGFSLEKIEGASLVSLAFGSVFGKWADVILSIAITLFAFSTLNF